MAIFIALWWLCSFLAIDGNDIIHSGTYCLGYTKGESEKEEVFGGGWDLISIFLETFFIFTESSFWL